MAVVYDAAHGFGALRNGAPVGREGLAQVFSTSPTKLLITGEGGVVATNDDELAQRVVVGREYGNPGTYDPLFVGFNGRLPKLSALLGLKGLALLEPEAERRNALAAVYRGLLGDLSGIGFQRIREQRPLVVQRLLGAHPRRRIRPDPRPGRRRAGRRGHRHARLLRAAGPPHAGFRRHRPRPSRNACPRRPRSPPRSSRCPLTAA